MAVQNRDTIARRQVDKFAERRDQLAAAALQTLAERGYANTSRDIAQNSEFLYGVLHEQYVLVDDEEKKKKTDRHVLLEFKTAENYMYRQEVKVQTLDGDTAADGEFRIVTDVVFDPNGKRSEQVVFALVF